MALRFANGGQPKNELKWSARVRKTACTRRIHTPEFRRKIGQPRAVPISRSIDWGGDAGYDFSSTGSKSIFAAMMKSFSVNPFTAWVHNSIATLR